MLRKLTIGAIVALSLVVTGVVPAFAQVVVGGKVNATVPPNPNTAPPTCFYFGLHGTGGFFAIQQSTIGYSETVAMVLLAASTGQILYVVTTPMQACGFTQISTAYISWPP